MPKVKIGCVTYTSYHRQLLLNNPYLDFTVKYDLKPFKGRLGYFFSGLKNILAGGKNMDVFFLWPSEFLNEEIKGITNRIKGRWNQIKLGEENVHQHVFYQQEFAKFYNLPKSCQRTQLYLSIEERLWGVWYIQQKLPPHQPIIFLAYDAGMHHKRMPQKLLLELCRCFLDMKLCVILLKGINTPDLAEAAAAKYRASFHVMKMKNLRNIAAVMSACDLVVTPDTFTSHMAGALDIPGIVLFGPSADRFKPYGNRIFLVDASSGCGYKERQWGCLECSHPQYAMTERRPGLCMDWFDNRDICRLVEQVLLA